MRLLIVIILIFTSNLLSSCAGQIFKHIEDVKYDTLRNNKVVFMKSLDTFLISSKDYLVLADKVVRKGDPVRLKYLMDGRKIAIVDRGVHSGTAMIYNFKSDRGLLLDDELCFAGRLFSFTPTPLGDDSFLIENDPQKTRFSLSNPKPCFELER